MRELAGGPSPTAKSIVATGLLLLALQSGDAWALAAPATAAAPATEVHAGIDDGSCGKCHAPSKIPIVDPAVLAKSAHADTTCAECHSDIEQLPHGDALETVDCGGCHRKEVRQLKAGAHHPVEAPSEEGKEPPTCVACHGAHDVHLVESVAFRDVIAGRCGECHEERYDTYMDRFHGKAATLGLEQAPRCYDCHTGHQQLPAEDPKSSVHADNLVETCGACHEGANANFVQFDPHPQPQDKEHSALVYYWWLFMVGLIVGTFAFFGVHDLLWLQRIVVAYARGEVHLKPMDTGPWVRRFTWQMSLSHVVLNVTFTLLALSGLPLMYAEAQWAQTLAALFGGQQIMRYVHFVSAAIFFGYFAIHVGSVFYRFWRTRDRGLFWGVNSLVPQGQDLVDMYLNLKWFLYIGDKPKLDRWTYWEKFDYWAVFWGMAIIGLSGVMMANAELYSRVFPGDWLNVAAVVHGEEALLAVGFITLFHFFHNHLRPENFPMDITIYTGVQPLERFKEERPVQYERMVREGRLDSMIVPPPTRFAVVFWTVYGSVIIGAMLFLTVAVVVSMVG
jgi:thiosulfate reductase cytochrome b subunit/nitrate/TMAO reductase-like tetraheme cytochrome c subunit